jgi:hypothetical protein
VSLGEGMDVGVSVECLFGFAIAADKVPLASAM